MGQDVLYPRDRPVRQKAEIFALQLALCLAASFSAARKRCRPSYHRAEQVAVVVFGPFGKQLCQRLLHRQMPRREPLPGEGRGLRVLEIGNAMRSESHETSTSVVLLVGS